MEKNDLSLHGKGLSVYTPRGGKSYAREDFERFFIKFPLFEFLRLIGGFSNQPIQELKGVPAPTGALAYLAMRAVESTNDYRGDFIPTLDDLVKALDMYWGLPDPIEEDGDAYSCLLRFGSTQFDYQRRINNLLPRSFAIYRDLWNTVASTIPVDSVIKTISGSSIEDILTFTYSYVGQSHKTGGFFRLYNAVDSDDKNIIELFDKEKQQAYIDWLTSNYKMFREKAREEFKKIPGSVYEKQQFNPLLKYPILKPDVNPSPENPQVYIIPVSHILQERVTRGLYFELSDHFKGNGRKNPFRENFGYVFQEYVGKLLKESVNTDCVVCEFKYDKKQNSTPDWMVIEDNACIFIEVKQGGLYLDAKLWGDVKTTKEDLNKTVGAGVQQLWKFEQAVYSGKFSELSFLSNIKEFHRLIVSYDNLYFANSLLRDMIRENFVKDGVSIPPEYNWQIISIDELEAVLGMHGKDLLNFLKQKQANIDDEQLDFNDYLGRNYADRDPSHPYLKRIEESFFERFEKAQRQ